MSADDHPHHSRPLRLIALFKLFKAAMFIVVGLGTLQLLNPDVTRVVRHALDVLATHADVQAIQRALVMFDALSPRRIEIIAAGAFLYSCLCMVEGLGLWWEKRWAEYVVVAATFSAVPFEIIALVRHLSFTRLTALLVNLAVAVYLIHCLRKPRAGLGSAQPSLIGPLILMAVLVAALAAPRTASGPRDSRPSSGRPSLSRAPPADRRLTNAAEGLDSLVESRRRRTLPWASRRCPPSCPQCRRILAR